MNKHLEMVKVSGSFGGGGGGGGSAGRRALRRAATRSMAGR